MKLYYSPGACSLAPHIVMREADRRFDLERVDLRADRTASGVDYGTINPRGSVPALQLDGAGSELLTEVPAVVQYIADLAPEKRLVPPSGTFARYHLQEWLSFISSELHVPLLALTSSDVPGSYAQKLRGKLGDRLGYLQGVLSDRGYLMGETFTVADAYLFVMLLWTERAGLDLALWPNLDDYESRMFRRPAIRDAMAAEGLAGRHRWKHSA